MEFNWTNKKVLVTGCAGILGSWLVKELLDKKAKVIGLIRDFTPSSELNLSGTINNITLVNGKLEDYFLMERCLNEYEIDTVFHLGAQTIVGVAERFPISTFESNIKGTWNLLEACKNNSRVKRVVVASSDKAYGESEKLPYKEDLPIIGRNPYDVSKSCADLISQSYFHTYGLNISIARCGNIYGGGDLNFNRIVPETMKCIINNEPLNIRSDGTYLRDYMYVIDGVRAYIRLAENTEKRGIVGEAFNFGTEMPTEVIEVVKKIIKISGKNIKPVILDQAKGEIRSQYLNCDKARKLLKWRPEFSFEKGLELTYDWYQKFFSDKR